MRAIFTGDGPGLCFAGSRDGSSGEYIGYVRVGESVTRVRTRSFWRGAGYFIYFYSVATGRYVSWVGGVPGNPPANLAGPLAQQVSTCRAA